MILQAKNTNKVLKIILTKMVNVYHIDWNIKLHTALWAYWTTYKVPTKYTLISILILRTKVLPPIAYVVGK